MPQLGETVTEGTITKWFKAVGDTVARDEPLFEVSTDKVDSEVPSPADGVLTAILVEEGDTVDVGVALAVIDGDAAAAPAPAPGGRGHAGRRPPATAPAPSRSAGPGRRPRLRLRPPLRRRSQPCRRAGVARVPRRPARRPSAARGARAGAPRAPADPRWAPTRRGCCRRWSAGSSPTTPSTPSTIRGTGLGGRITRADVEAVIERGGPPAAVPEHRRRPHRRRRPPPRRSRRPPRHRAGPPRPPAAGDGVRPGERDEVVPFTNIRRRTAEHMVRSKATSAHTLMVMEADYEHVEQVRRAHGERFREEEGSASPTSRSSPGPRSRRCASAPISTRRWATTP